MNIPNRALARNVAVNFLNKEKQEGKTYSVEAVTHCWAVDYNLVDEKDIPNFQKQVALEVEAERFSRTHSTVISKVGMLELNLASVTGTLAAGPKGGMDPLPEQ